MCKAKQRKWKLYFTDVLLKAFAIGQTFGQRAVQKGESLFKIGSAGTGFSLFYLLFFLEWPMMSPDSFRYIPEPLSRKDSTLVTVEQKNFKTLPH